MLKLRVDVKKATWFDQETASSWLDLCPHLVYMWLDGSGRVVSKIFPRKSSSQWLLSFSLSLSLSPFLPLFLSLSSKDHDFYRNNFFF
jgi:hypothetical protein